MKLITTKIWQAVCSEDIDTLDNLKEHWENKHITHLAFGIEHSLIMGALRNRNWQTVSYLIKNGESILPHEINELIQDFREVLSLI